ncbi:A-kinase anchor protein 17A-like [Littorina saxatilis]|uniref:A-kinase anchor protein 17A n=1 Tax=Littorina saxatilis TaxID=31220 RepID=A0AAN9G7X5_9CAEN
MANTSVCNDTSEAIELYEPQGLYLKPVARLNICAQLPQLKTPGKTISNWEVMEKVKNMIRPETFLSVKVAKSTMEFIRLEGEIENKSKLPLLIMKLDGKTIKLSGFPESLKVRAAEAKVPFPVRHDWDSYFRDARNMNELRPGERPDTVYMQDLPTRWFSKHDKGRGTEQKLRPSEEIVRRVFETFGEVRCVDIPMLDPFRKEIMGSLAKPGMITTFNYGQDIKFDVYVQYKDYISFVKAMDAMRGMKLLYKEDEDKALTANIRVDFDKHKHLSDKMLRKRRLERERLQALEDLRMQQERQEKEEEEAKREAERMKKVNAERERQRKKEERQRLKEERRKEREEKRRQKRVEKKQKEEEERMQLKIALEERRLLIAQRKLESLRLLSELFERVKDVKVKQDVAQQEEELEEKRKQEVLEEQRRRLEEERQKAEAKIQKKLQMRQQEVELREKILKNVKAKEQKTQDKQREELRLKMSGSRRLKSAVIMKKRLSSITRSNQSSSDSDNETKPGAKDGKEQSKSGKEQSKSGKEQSKGGGGDEGEKGEEKSKKVEVENEDSNSGIELITSSDEDEGPSHKKKKPSSTMERVLQANKLRGWGGEPEEEDEEEEGGGKKADPFSNKPRPVPIRRTFKKDKILIIKRVMDRDDSKKDDSDSDSGDSTITIIPPPRSSFAPPDDPANFMPPPGFMPPPWAFPVPGMMPPPWAGPPPPPGFMPPPWFGPRGPGPGFGRGRGRGRGRGFHTFKEPYLKKSNLPRKDSPEPEESGTISYKLSQKLSTKKDLDGRYMYPLT